MKRISNLFIFLKMAVHTDLMQIRNGLCLGLFNLLPDMLILSPAKNLILKMGGAKISIFGNYIKSPFYCSNLQNFEMGRGNFFNKFVYIDSSAKVSFGHRNQIGPYTKIATTNHNIKNNMETISLPVNIGSQCWIGMAVIFNPGTSLANKNLVASGAVVTKNLNEEESVYGGTPAKLIKKLE